MITVTIYLNVYVQYHRSQLDEIIKKIFYNGNLYIITHIKRNYIVITLNVQYNNNKLGKKTKK